MLRPRSGIASGDCYVQVWPPGTTRRRHCLISEEIYFAVTKIHGFTVPYSGFECERKLSRLGAKSRTQ